MNYASIRKYDVSNWAGINSTLFVSGCKFHCKGCWNEEAQDFNYGKPYTKEVEDLFISYCKDDKVDGQFEEDKKDLTLLHKGSTNQREVDVKASLEKGEYVEYKF